MRSLFYLFLFIFAVAAQAQDERFVRQMLSGDLAPGGRPKAEPTPHFHVTSSLYEIDLNGDDRVEYIVMEKKDAQDWLHIHSYDKQRIFSLKLVPRGWKSDVYRVNLRQLSDQTKVLLVHYYEGSNQGIDFVGTGRLYVVSLDNNDLQTLRGHRGPQIWEEFKDTKIHYHQRPHHVSLFDLDSDGVREITVRHHLHPKVLKYAGNGGWIEAR